MPSTAKTRIRVEWRTRKGDLIGFRVAGHAGDAPAGESIVCAAVSSAALMTANTVTDVLKLPAAVSCEDGLLELTVTGDPTPCRHLLEGFRLHMQELMNEYPQWIQLTNTEV